MASHRALKDKKPSLQPIYEAAAPKAANEQGTKNSNKRDMNCYY